MLLSVEDMLFVGKRLRSVRRCFLMNKSYGICKVSSVEAGAVMTVRIREPWRLSNTSPELLCQRVTWTHIGLGLSPVVFRCAENTVT